MTPMKTQLVRNCRGEIVRDLCLVGIQAKAKSAHELKSGIEAFEIAVAQSDEPEWMFHGSALLLAQKLYQTAYGAESGIELNLSNISCCDAGGEFSQAAGERKPLQYPGNHCSIDVETDHFVIGNANSRRAFLGLRLGEVGHDEVDHATASPGIEGYRRVRP